MDRRRIVELDPGGRPLTILDLADPVRWVPTRDSFAYTPPAPQDRQVTYQDRWRGARTVGQSHGNGAIAGTWDVAGYTHDDCLANAAAFIEAIERARKGRLFEWRPDGASYSSYFELRGPGTFVPKYRWVVFHGIRGIEIDFTWPTAPLVRWDRMDIGDDFTAADSLDDYAFDEVGA